VKIFGACSIVAKRQKQLRSFSTKDSTRKHHQGAKLYLTFRFCLPNLQEMISTALALGMLDGG